MKMRFSHYSMIITCFMAAIGFSALFLVETVSFAFIAFAAFFAIASLPYNIKRLDVFTARHFSALAAVIFAFFIADYLWLSKSLITAGARFLTVLMVLKLYDLRKSRDYQMLYALVFFQILAAAASTASLSFLALLSLFVLGAIWAMILFSMKKDFEEAGKSESDVPRGLFGARFFVAIAAVTALSIAVTFALFFIIPRMGVGFFERKTLDTVKVSGFSDRVDLGSIGPVKTDSTVVMRVELPSGRVPERPLYFRGAVLDSYDARAWTRTIKDETLLRKGPDGRFKATAPSGPLLEQTILLEPLETEAVFAASAPVYIEGRFPNLWVDSTGALRLPSPPYSRIQYTAWSDISGRQGALTEPPAVYSGTPYLDTSPVGARIRELTEEVTAGLKTAPEKARAIERHLRGGYRYTLDPGKGEGADPIDDFLFYTKEGYCEHYATAMALMLRAAGIPSRVVTGFLQGEWNSYGGYFIVRQSDAHSWVEAYDGASGWASFDPTPGSAAAPARPSNLSLYIDLLRLKWSRYVIQYSFADQRRAAFALEGRAAGLVASLKKALRPDGQVPTWSAAVAVAAAAVVAAIVMALRRKKNALRGAKTPRFYAEMARILERRGLKRLSGETPAEFARRCGRDEALEITLAFEEVRYGETGLTAEREKNVTLALKRLKDRKAG